jgi:5-methylcytosine-specific restriction endonuclease McrA
MITIELHDGRFCPVITCDRCGGRITDLDATPANFEWSMDADPGGVTATRIVHKAFCCPAPRDQALTYWQPLEKWLVYTAANAGLSIPAGAPGVCFECGQPAGANHHVVPRSLGGTRTLPLCDDCHAAIHSTGQPLSLGRLARLARQRGAAT